MSQLHLIQNVSRVRKSVSWKIEENSLLSTKLAPLKRKTKILRMLLVSLVGGYITLCK